MTERSVVQVTLWNSPYLGNFMSSELVLAGAVRARFGLGTHFVLEHGARRRRGRWELAFQDRHARTARTHAEVAERRVCVLRVGGHVGDGGEPAGGCDNRSFASAKQAVVVHNVPDAYRIAARVPRFDIGPDTGV